MSDVQNIKVLESEAGLSLSRYFKKKFSEIPHSMVEKWCRKGNIRIDGKRAKANNLLVYGQIIRVPPLPLLNQSPLKRSYNLTHDDKRLIQSITLYEDEHLIVLNKPQGLAVQGGTGTYRHIDGLLNFFASDERAKPHLVHRLDRDTSGVLLVAKTPQVAHWLMKAFKAKSIDKTYWALIVGKPNPSERIISLAIDKVKAGDKEKMEITPTGKSAVTHLKVLDYAAEGTGISWVELKPETGRTHQLRVHCQAIDHPILGDKKYGGDKAQPFNEKVKMHLHARSIKVTYPNGVDRTFEAPLPDHMRLTFNRLGFKED